MTRNPATADAAQPLGEVLELLFDLDVRHLPILDEGQLVGIVSDRDLRGLASSMSEEGVGSPLNEPVSRVMSSDVLSIDPESELADLVDLMIEHKVGAVPVVAGDTGDLVGIVSYIDVLRVARDSL